MDKISTTKPVDYYWILDWKYKPAGIFLCKNYGVDEDITKQLCYEFCLKSNPLYSDVSMRNQFVIPYFYKEISEENRIGDEIKEKYLYHRLNESKIEVFKANFYTMQDAYLNND